MNRTILIIFSIITLDMLGIGLIIPIVAPMILHANSPFISIDTSEHLRIVIQGIALALYPIFQFFGAPLLGMIADNKGRKPMLLLTLAGTAIGYVLAMISFWFGAIWIFLFSRAIDGFTGGNISIANAVISDISKPDEKAKNFGMIGAAFGTGMVIGPFLGGVLSDPSIVSWFSYQTPFILACILSFLNFLIVWKWLPETLKNPRPIGKISLFMGVKHLIHAFSHPKLKRLFIVLFCYISGFAFFTNFFQVFAIERFQFTSKDIGLTFAFLGVCIILAQAIFLRIILKFYTIEFWVKNALLGLSLLLFSHVFLYQYWELYPIMFLMAIANGILFANITTIISNQVPKNEQGEIMGIKESLQAFGTGISALLASIAGIFGVNIPMIIAGALVLLGWWIFERR